MHVFENPFRRAIKVLKDDFEKSKNKVEISKTKQAERWIEDEKETFKLPNPKKEEEKVKPSNAMSSQILNDYY